MGLSVSDERAFRNLGLRFRVLRVKGLSTGMAFLQAVDLRVFDSCARLLVVLLQGVLGSGFCFCGG